MGITIHYRGTLPGREAYDRLRHLASGYARERGWGMQDIETDAALADRISGADVVTTIGPLRGLILFPHEWCEPLHLTFDADWRMGFFTKTQFAGVDTHVAVIELLRLLQPLFSSLEVYDEGGYWQTNDRKVLEERIDGINNALGILSDAIPDSETGVAIPGRPFIDLNHDDEQDEES